LNSLIEEITGDLDPFLRVSKQAGDVSRSLAVDKLGIIITGICNTGCYASTIQEVDVETYHICFEEAQELQPEKTEANNCVTAKGTWGKLMHFNRCSSGCIWSGSSSFYIGSEEGDCLPNC
jgi:hypothetical protein